MIIAGGYATLTPGYFPASPSGFQVTAAQARLHFNKPERGKDSSLIAIIAINGLAAGRFWIDASVRMNYKIKQRSSIAGAPILSRPSYSTQRPQSLTTEILAHQLDAFRAGYLREAALT